MADPATALRPDRQAAKIARLSAAPRVEFGPLAHYRPLLADGTTPARTGVQISEPGYVAPMHWHPYTEMLLILEGTAEVWLEGDEDRPQRLDVGDMVALPPHVPHAFRTVGDRTMTLLGIHCSPDRVVNYLDGRATAGDGYPVLDADLRPVAE